MSARAAHHRHETRGVVPLLGASSAPRRPKRHSAPSRRRNAVLGGLCAARAAPSSVAGVEHAAERAPTEPVTSDEAARTRDAAFSPLAALDPAARLPPAGRAAAL